ncbi:MAG: hypothetical protein ACPGEG_05635 [Salibacteraceae bacterium]
MARRLLIFSVGFFMGCVAVYAFLFKGTDRDFYGAWLPDGRVLKKINNSIDRSSTKYKCLIENAGVFPSELDLLLTDGNVDFSKSDTKNKKKKYFTEIELEGGRNIQAEFVIMKDSAWLTQVGIGQFLEADCD